ncbi:MAG: putative lipid II flippase FtsW [Actinobacteria bacterium]|uniref:peptidoglycan glycosyltransferase n=1 Tax=freshwater metagenome TaxID=449393 RepID=A0A6J7A5I1_9ZZZZ|nr:putative lipid II flippase FtsW [Actinomycetota bacterium]
MTAIDHGGDQTTADPEILDRRLSGRIKVLLAHPLSTYYLLIGASMLLLVLGVIMVLSASSIESYRVFGSAYTLAQRQAMFAVIGVIVMILAARTAVVLWRKISWLLLIITLLLLILVLFIGVEVAGQRNWIDLFGPFRLQPSEFAKFALIVWGADLLSRKSHLLSNWKHLLIPLLPVAGLMMVLVLLEGDFGNAFMLAAITCGMLFAIGAPLRLFALIAGLGALGVWLLTIAAPYRMDRFSAWLSPGNDRLGADWQVNQGQYALGTGGFWGVGLGASREKWGALPEAHTDFIFPVIGEELGLVGTLAVLGLFAILAFAIFRLSRTTSDAFVRVAAAGVGSWIVVQAILNIGSVLGLLPITGVPLPLVSYGGSSLLPILAAIGMLLAFTRQEPAARTALRRKSTAMSLRRR